ncbi:piggyBac transposable element-derived protein 4 isoform X2 [Electrophorus electricus]|uniref:piggyBac transposable element-derived protein 4 isoform X2 n=1 Tax=Electrophorus electricus TaxID=8005 RepID=UPI0015D07D02|nr:piggyBac transposable element-derived protein 4 isoform X2 [Electrophorus electricus]
MAASMDSVEEDAFELGIDVLDMSEEDSPCSAPPEIFHNSSGPLPGPSTSTLPQFVDTPHISAEEQPHVPAKKTRTAPAVPPPAALEDRWRDPSEEDEQPPPLRFHPRRTPGVQLDFHMVYSPSDIFQLFFSQEVLLTLCNNTNKYAAKKTEKGLRRQWTNVNADEMLRFISIVIYLGLIKPSAIRDLWRKDHLHRHPFPPSVMTGKRYEAISANLHMSDPAADAINDQLRGQPGYDSLFRLKPLMEQTLTACKAYYHPHKNIAVDERMVATKARISMKQYMKNKPSKWGYKIFVLADSSNGYTYNFSVYEGKACKPSGNGLSFDVVVNLIHVPSLGTGYTVYVDNFYTSSLLFHHLHRIGFGACGTIRENRIVSTKTFANDLPKKAARGDMRWTRDGPLLFVKWRDTRDVTMCSTVHKAYSGKTVQRLVRTKSGTWSSKQIPVPDTVNAYNKFMGGVDLSDALIKYFSVTQKTRRWYMKLFLHFIDIVVVNSFIIHKEMALAKKQKPLNQKRFREVLCSELAGVGLPQESPPARAPSAPLSPPHVPEERPQGCFPVPVCELSTDVRQKATQGRRKCVHCKMKTIFMCRSCSVPLCVVVDRLCFTEWHDQKT